MREKTQLAIGCRLGFSDTATPLRPVPNIYIYPYTKENCALFKYRLLTVNIDDGQIQVEVTLPNGDSFHIALWIADDRTQPPWVRKNLKTGSYDVAAMYFNDVNYEE